MMDRAPKIAFGIVLVTSLVLVASAAAAPEARDRGVAETRGPLPVSNTVGIRVTVSNVDVAMRSADLDLTVYTRGYGPNGAAGAYAGVPMLGYPALDFGDGSTLPSATLALTDLGGGPGGSNVYRSLASFSHTYPATGAATARAAVSCVGCFRLSYVLFPPGSPAPAAFTATSDRRPTSVIGNLPLRLDYAGTSYNAFLSTSVRYASAYYPVITNTAPVFLPSVLEIPTASSWGLIALGASLLGAGIIALRRRV